MSDRAGTLDLNISGIHIRLSGPGDETLSLFREAWSGWLGSPVEYPDLTLKYRIIGEAPADQTTLHKVLRTEQGNGWIRFTTGEGSVELDRAGGLASAQLLNGGDRFRFYGLQNLLLAALARVLPNLGFMVVHGAAILLEQSAVALIGPEGAGKTTWARIAAEEGAGLFSDDLLILGLDDGDPVALGSPFRGGDVPSGRFPLAMLLSAKHAERASILPCNRLAFQALLSANLPFSADQVGGDTALDRLLDRFLDAVPFHTLAFAPERSYLELLRTALIDRS